MHVHDQMRYAHVTMACCRAGNVRKSSQAYKLQYTDAPHNLKPSVPATTCTDAEADGNGHAAAEDQCVTACITVASAAYIPQVSSHAMCWP